MRNGGDRINIYRWLEYMFRTITPGMFRILYEWCHAAFEKEEFRESLCETLDLAGQHFKTSNAFICLIETPQNRGFAYEWCANTAFSNLLMLEKMSKSLLPEELIAAFGKDGICIASNITDLAPGIYDVLYPSGVCSIMLLPIQGKEDTARGFLGIADNRYRVWQPDEIVMLWSLRGIIKDKLLKEQLKP